MEGPIPVVMTAEQRAQLEADPNWVRRAPYVVKFNTLTQADIDEIVNRPWPLIALDNVQDVQVIQPSVFDDMARMQTEDGEI